MSDPAPADRLRVTMVRCATLVLEWRGLRVLTDPWFAMHLRGLPCFRRPGLTPAQVGPVDAVLVSHLHPDHFDGPAYGRLVPRPRLVVAPVGARARLGRAAPEGLRELAPWDQVSVDAVCIYAVPGPHTLPKPDEINFVLDIPSWGRVFFGGDARFDRTVLGAVAERFAPFRLALLPVGGTRILGRRTVMAPDDALEAARLLAAAITIPIHEGGIWMSVPPLSFHPGRARHLVAASVAAGSPCRVLVLEEGDSATL